MFLLKRSSVFCRKWKNTKRVECLNVFWVGSSRVIVLVIVIVLVLHVAGGQTCLFFNCRQLNCSWFVTASFEDNLHFKQSTMTIVERVMLQVHLKIIR